LSDADLLELLAAGLDRPVHRLVLLDQRPLQLLLVPGSYLTVTVRDTVSREVLEPTLDLDSGRLVEAEGLRAADRAAAAERTALSPGLRSLLLRHPDLAALTVVVTRSGGTTELFTGDAAEVLDLADRPDVSSVDVAGDVVIRD
jgi:hypothetical protein